MQRQASPNIVIALAGNKADLAAKRAVEFDEAKGYAEENGLLFMETSAKTAMNVNDIFLAIGNLLSLSIHNVILIILLLNAAKKLPKNDGSGGVGGSSGQGRRLDRAEDGNKPASSCCK